MQQFALYRTTLFLVLLYKNNCKGVIYDYGNDECPCDQSDSSCLVLTYLDGEELKRIEKCADIWQAEDICHDYKSKLANIVSCKVEQQSFKDSPNIIDVETKTVRNIDVVKRDIANMWYLQMDSIDVTDIPITTDEPSEDPTTSDLPTTEDEPTTTDADSSSADISTITTSVISTSTSPASTSSTDVSTTTGSATSNGEPDQPSSTSSSTTEGSVTRTPRPFPNNGNKVNLTILHSLFCVVAVLSLNLSSGYLNVY